MTIGGNGQIWAIATAVSNADLDCLARHPGVLVNCDALSAIRRLGQRCPSREIGVLEGVLADCAWYLERCPTIDTIDIGGGLGVPLTADHQPLTIAGNINEVIDLFAQDIWLPMPREGDILALLNVGGYGAASSSNHCMRGQFTEYMLGMAPPE